jgi:PAS domain S-box-containing protein
MPEKNTHEELVKKISELEENAKRFKLMVDFTHSWEYWIKPDAKMFYVSPSCKNYTGYSQKEFMENDDLLLAIVHPDDKDKMIKHIEYEHNDTRVESMEFRILDRSGKVRWFSHTCRAVYDENDAYLGRRASNLEITDQKQFEMQRDELTGNLRKTSILLNTVLDAIPDVIGVQDPQHRIIRYNEAGYRFLGMEPYEVHGKKCYELIGRSRPCHICATAEVYKTKKVAQVEKYVEELDTWLDARAYPVLDENNDISRVIEHLRDISEEKNTEIKLREAHERLITILDSIDAHIYVADLKTFEILFMNQKMIDDYNEDFVGKICYESFRNEFKPCDHCTNHHLIAENQEPTGVQTWERLNPITNRWYIHYNRAIKWVDGRIVRIQIATDITDTKNSENERLKMEHQLLQAQKFEAIGTLAGGIAHDFNNLLMGIRGCTSLISADLEPSHPFSENINAIEEYVRSATDLTRQLLGFSREGKYEVRPFNINELLVESARMFGRTKKEVLIHTELHDPPPVAAADRRQIEQVLLNLYVNAWQAMPQGGAIYLKTSVLYLDEVYCEPHAVKPDQYVNISVRDTGIGMDKETLQRIFDPFFTTKEKGRGTGLGLASAYGIIKNHAGIITVSSKVGQGTTFDIYLPVSDQEAERELPRNTGIVKGSGTILLVDDEEMIIKVGQAMLEKLGYHVLIAKSGKIAIEKVYSQGNTIDLVILDLIMPGMDGGKTFDSIRSINPRIPVILSSGYSISGKATDIMQRGCNGFIQKPFNISELSHQVRKVLDKVQAPNENSLN